MSVDSFGNLDNDTSPRALLDHARSLMGPWQGDETTPGDLRKFAARMKRSGAADSLKTARELRNRGNRIVESLSDDATAISHLTSAVAYWYMWGGYNIAEQREREATLGRLQAKYTLAVAPAEADFALAEKLTRQARQLVWSARKDAAIGCIQSVFHKATETFGRKN